MVKASTATAARRPAAGVPAEHVNEVRLVGRLAGDPVPRDLPSGDPLVSFRLVVERGGTGARPDGRRLPTVDTLDCAAWRADVRRTLGRLHAGDVVAVEGALRRRFWRTAAGPASRSEVEVLRVRRLAAG